MIRLKMTQIVYSVKTNEFSLNNDKNILLIKSYKLIYPWFNHKYMY